MTARHSQQTATLGIHTPYRWMWADVDARTAETDVVQYDVDNASVGIQLDENTEWRATDVAPTWQQIGAGGAGDNQHLIDVANNVDILTVVELIRRTTATPLDGIGGSLDIKVDKGSDIVAGRLIAAWKDVATGDSVIILTQTCNETETVGLAIGPTPGSVTPADIVALIGEGAVDLMPIKESSAKIPMGLGSGLFAGSDNEATGEYSVALGGSENVAGADMSVVTGLFSVSRIPQSIAHASGSFSTPGDAQRHQFIMRTQTGDNTPTPLDIPGGGNISFVDDTTFVIKIDINARCTSAPPINAYYQGWCRGYCAAGVVTISASDKVIESEDTGVWDFNFSASTNEVIISVEGMPTDDVDWMADVVILEMIG